MTLKLNERRRTVITIFFLVLLGCIIGWVYEMLFYRIDRGEFIRRGQAIGPYLPIYGFGALALTLLTYKRKIHPAIIFVISMVSSGILEYATGWVLYNCFGGMRLWDYNTEIWNFGNIGGYVCLRSVLVFGVFGTLYCMFLIPLYFRLTKKASDRKLLSFAIPIAVIFFADIIFGYIVKPILNAFG